MTSRSIPTPPDPYAEMHALRARGLVRSWRYYPMGTEVVVKAMLNPAYFTRDEAAYGAPDLASALIGVMWWMDELMRDDVAIDELDELEAA